MRVAGHAIVLFGAVIARTNNTNRAGFGYVVPHMLRYSNDFKPQCMIVNKEY